MYEAVYVYPDGDSTAARMGLTAGQMGFDGILCRLCDPESFVASDDENLDVVVSACGEIEAATPQQASEELTTHRTERVLVIVRGGTDQLNRFAVEHEMVDVLSQPFTGQQNSTGNLNHVLAKSAGRNDVAIEVNIGPLLRERGGTRVAHLRHLIKLKRLINKYSLKYVVSAAPRSHLELRGVHELCALGEQSGLGGDWIRRGISQWGDILERNRNRRADSFVGPGVKRSSPSDKS
ncbi:MAG: RNase P/RNase MRP subunit p30 [Haloquadratum sp. J07HQX50]|nr:MAG: RNase P/RNase MRP subunit p30 [Haloquadratum sp. J07HQX50]